MTTTALETHTLAVLRQFRYGDVVTTGALFAATGLDRGGVLNALSRLCAAKQIVRVKRGMYLKAANPPPLPPKMSGVWPERPKKEPRVRCKPVAPRPEPLVSSANIVRQAIESRHLLATVWGAR